jgi:multidrug efflux pump subunit AcrB
MACNKTLKWGLTFVATTLAVIVSLFGQSATTASQKKSSYMPVVDKEDFSTIHDRMSAAKAEIMKRQMDLLTERYDLSNRPAQGVVMDRKKPVQEVCE